MAKKEQPEVEQTEEAESEEEEAEESSDEGAESEDNEAIENPIGATEQSVAAEVDTTAIAVVPKFSGRTGSKGNSWNQEVIKELLSKLKTETEAGTVRVIPIAFVWAKLRKTDKPLAWPGWASRKQLLEAATDLGLKLEIHETGCKAYKVDQGQLEVKFL